MTVASFQSCPSTTIPSYGLNKQNVDDFIKKIEKEIQECANLILGEFARKIVTANNSVNGLGEMLKSAPEPVGELTITTIVNKKKAESYTQLLTDVLLKKISDKDVINTVKILQTLGQQTNLKPLSNEVFKETDSKVKHLLNSNDKLQALIDSFSQAKELSIGKENMIGKKATASENLRCAITSRIIITAFNKAYPAFFPQFLQVYKASSTSDQK